MSGKKIKAKARELRDSMYESSEKLRKRYENRNEYGTHDTVHCACLNNDHWKIELLNALFYTACFAVAISLVLTNTGSHWLLTRHRQYNEEVMKRPFKVTIFIIILSAMEAVMHWAQMFRARDNEEVAEKRSPSVWFSFSVSTGLLTYAVANAVGIEEVYTLICMGVLVMGGFAAQALSEEFNNNHAPQNVSKEALDAFKMSSFFLRLKVFLAGSLASFIPWIMIIIDFAHDQGSGNNSMYALVCGGFALICIHHLIRVVLVFAQIGGKTSYYIHLALKGTINIYLITTLFSGALKDYTQVNAA